MKLYIDQTGASVYISAAKCSTFLTSWQRGEYVTHVQVTKLSPCFKSNKTNEVIAQIKQVTNQIV